MDRPGTDRDNFGSEWSQIAPAHPISAYQPREVSTQSGLRKLGTFSWSQKSSTPLPVVRAASSLVHYPTQPASPLANHSDRQFSPIQQQTRRRLAQPHTTNRQNGSSSLQRKGNFSLRAPVLADRPRVAQDHSRPGRGADLQVRTADRRARTNPGRDIEAAGEAQWPPIDARPVVRDDAASKEG